MRDRKTQKRTTHIDIGVVAELVLTAQGSAPGTDVYERAMTELYEQCNPWIHIYASRFQSRLQDLEETAQAVWFRVIVGLCQVKQPYAFVGWLYRVTINYLKEQRRDKNRMCQLDDEQLKLASERHSVNEEHVFLENSHYQLVRTELSELLTVISKPVDREVLVLHLAGGVKFTHMPNLPYTSEYARVVCHRNLAKLRTEVNERPQCFPSLLGR